MQYRKLGNTGKELSILGYGTMRLPVIDNVEANIDEKRAISLIRQGIDQGINLVDSAYPYHEGNSEALVAKALKDGYRDKTYLSTKLPTWAVKGPEDFDKYLDRQLKRLEVEKIDLYFIHTLKKKTFNDIVLGFNLIEQAQKAKEAGKIDHLCFSFHDTPDVLKTIIDTNSFDAMLVQYNLLDQSNADMMAYAKSKGMGVLVMGPVAGGRLEEPVPEVKAAMEKQGRKYFNPQIALNFVWSNPNVDVALSGMGNEQMLTSNLLSAKNFNQYSPAEIAELNEMVAEYKALSNLYCSGCKYCLPCPEKVNIPACFEMLGYYKIYGAHEYAKKMYNEIGYWPFLPGKNAQACIECGICEEQCPQQIPIREQLREVKEILGAY